MKRGIFFTLAILGLTTMPSYWSGPKHRYVPYETQTVVQAIGEPFANLTTEQKETLIQKLNKTPLDMRKEITSLYEEPTAYYHNHQKEHNPKFLETLGQSAFNEYQKRFPWIKGKEELKKYEKEHSTPHPDELFLEGIRTLEFAASIPRR